MFFNSIEKYWQIPEQRGFKKRKWMETDGNKVKQSNCQDLSSIFHKSIKSKRLTSNTLEPLSSINLEMHKVS